MTNCILLQKVLILCQVNIPLPFLLLGMGFWVISTWKILDGDYLKLYNIVRPCVDRGEWEDRNASWNWESRNWNGWLLFHYFHTWMQTESGGIRIINGNCWNVWSLAEFLSDMQLPAKSLKKHGTRLPFLTV